MADEIREETKKGLSRRQFLRGVGAAAATATVVGAVAFRPKTDEPKQGPKTDLDAIPGAVPVSLKVNGKTHQLNLEPRVTLLDALRERLQLTGAKKICDMGNCGGCTVYMDGKPIYACLKLAVDSQGHDIETIESLAPEGKMTPLQQAFVDHDALQCGFCTPGFVMSVNHLLKTNPNPTLDDVKQACCGNICRCGTYTRIFEAALAAAKARKGAF
jgi:xanthine dehydrogenase YagT iron-sulfur-binding subunit